MPTPPLQVHGRRTRSARLRRRTSNKPSMKELRELLQYAYNLTRLPKSIKKLLSDNEPKPLR